MSSDAPSPTTQDRVMDLEIRLSFMEKTLEDLDGVVRGVADEVERLRMALKELEGKVEAFGEPQTSRESLLYEKPPHY